MLYPILLHNLSLQKAGPLSETRTSGSPKAAKVVCNLSIVVALVALVVTCTTSCERHRAVVYSCLWKV